MKEKNIMIKEIDGFKEFRNDVNKFASAMSSYNKCMNRCIKSLDVNRVHLENLYYWKEYSAKLPRRYK
jgi:hypothetical protein